jgi:Cytochrome c554 and c-prime
MMNKLLLLVFLTLVTMTLAWQFHPKDENPYYVTSLACNQCHIDKYNSWNKTLHSKVFRPVEGDDDILGDFTVTNPILTFSKDEVEYIIGNRLEQIYARKIDGEYYPFTARWYVKQQQWAPYKVDTWEKTPMSEKCNGCHTTGFNPNTYEFSEFGVGCESCHGPGSKHIANKKMNVSLVCRVCHWSEPETQTDIIRSVSSTVCGQCHNRGKNIPFSDQEESVFDFPVQYTPGEDLKKSFKTLSLEDDKNNRYWWGNGIAKARHQEFADWEKSNHAKTLTRMKQNYTEQTGTPQDTCLECHSTDYLLPGSGQKPTIRTAKFGITCVSCHNPHRIIREGDSKHKRNEPCIDCHLGLNAKCPKKTDPVHFPCPPDKVECVDCHMPYVVKSGGWNSIRGHAFVIVSPLDTERQALMPNSCQNGSCHVGESLQWAQQEYNNFYNNNPNDN